MICAWFAIFASFAAWSSAPSDLFSKPVDERVRELKELPRAQWSTLSRVAFDENAKLSARWRALTTMGKLDAKHFQKDIERALLSHEWFMRNAGLIASLNLDADFKARATLRALRDPALVVRTQAVRNIIALDLRAAETALWFELGNERNFKGQESLWIRAHIAEALAGWARPGQALAFKRMLLDPDERLHKWAVRGLEKSLGYKLGGPADPIEVQRTQWLSRLGAESI